MFTSSRTFQVWDYNISHRQLLLRSPKETGNSDNIDIVFWGLDGLQINCVLSGVALSSSETGVYTILSGAEIFTLRAAGVKILSNQLDVMTSSLYYLHRELSEEAYGRTLFIG